MPDEDEELWPPCETIEPGVAAVLRDLSAEHRRLDAALDTLDIAPIGCGPETELLAAAVTASAISCVLRGQERRAGVAFAVPAQFCHVIG